MVLLLPKRSLATKVAFAPVEGKPLRLVLAAKPNELTRLITPQCHEISTSADVVMFSESQTQPKCTR